MQDMEDEKQGRRWLFRSADRLSLPVGVPNQPTSSRFTLQFQDTLPDGEYEILWATIPNTVYNVDESADSLNFETESMGGGIQEDSILEHKNYTPDDLATALSAIQYFDTVSNGTYNLAWAYDPTTFRFSVTNNAPTAGYLHPGPTSLLRKLGFAPPVGENPLPILLPPGVPITALVTSQLSTPLSISVSIPQAVTEGFTTAGSVYRGDGSNIRTLNNFKATLSLPYLASAGSYNFITRENFKQTFKLRGHRNQLAFEVRNPDNRQILNLNGGEWEMFVQKL